MFTARPDSRKDRGDDASMDEILASIRRIIAEEPNDQQRRATPSNGPRGQQVGRPSRPGIEGSMRQPAPAQPMVVRPAPRASMPRPASPTPPADDVLDELLEPVAAEAHFKPAAQASVIARAPAVAKPMPPVEQQSRAPLIPRDTAMAATPPPPSAGEMATRSDAPSAEGGQAIVSAKAAAPEVVVPTIVSPIDDELRRAQDALGALAAGLAAVSQDTARSMDVPPVAADPVPAQATTGAPPSSSAVVDENSAAAADAGPSRTPAEAAAEAVAAVAAANGAAAGHPAGSAAPAVAEVEPVAVVEEPTPVEAQVATAEIDETSVPVAAAATAEEAPVAQGAEPTPAPAASERAPDIVDAPSPQPSSVATVASGQGAPLDGPTAASAPQGSLVPVPPPSFEDAIAAMLRPLLREWLNANMPRMVEKALKEELAQSGGLLGYTTPAGPAC